MNSRVRLRRRLRLRRRVQVNPSNGNSIFTSHDARGQLSLLAREAPTPIGTNVYSPSEVMMMICLPPQGTPPPPPPHTPPTPPTPPPHPPPPAAPPPPPGGPPPPHTHTQQPAWPTAHTAHSSTLRPHRATQRVEDKPPQTRRPHSNGLCSPRVNPEEKLVTHTRQVQHHK